MKLLELDKKGDLTYETQYKYLYHLTDHHGFAYSIDQNALRTLRYNYISTTYDPKMNSVYGQWHHHFKFVLKAQPLVKKYGAFPFDAHIQVGNEGYKSLNEQELGLNTREVSPLKDYVVGAILLFPLFSQTGVQWLLYNNHASKSFMDTAKAEAPRAIETLYTFLIEWKKPVWIGNMHRKPSEQDLAFLKDALHIHQRGGDFDEGMRELADKYNIVDHSGRILDKQTVWRTQQSEQAYNMLNAYYGERKFKDVNVNVVRRIIKGIFDILKLNNNIQSIVMNAIEKAGLFHPATAAVDWAIIIKELMYGDIDGTLEAIQWVSEDRKRNRDWYDKDPTSYATHSKTMF